MCCAARTPRARARVVAALTLIDSPLSQDSFAGLMCISRGGIQHTFKRSRRRLSQMGLKEAICALHAFNRIAARERKRARGSSLCWCAVRPFSSSFCCGPLVQIIFHSIDSFAAAVTEPHCTGTDRRVCAALMAFSYFGLCLLMAVRDMTAIEIADTSGLLE